MDNRLIVLTRQLLYCVCTEQVCEQVRLGYGDAYLTAHFEVPGEMFSLAMAAKRRGMGVVGSTSNILDFIASKVCEIRLKITLPGPSQIINKK